MEVSRPANLGNMVSERQVAPRVTPRVTILSERGTIDPAMATPGTGGKLRMRLDVPSRIDSDLLLFKASPL